jgi:hypothetical protein
MIEKDTEIHLEIFVILGIGRGDGGGGWKACFMTFEYQAEII